SRLVDAGSSGQIDRDVRALVGDALSIYRVDAEALAAARPDVIVTQDLCEVCAVSLDDVRAAAARLAERDHVDVVTLSPTRLDQVLDDVVRLADAIGVRDRGEHERAALGARIEEIAARARAPGHRPRVASIEWLDPIMLGGTWMPDLIDHAGGEAVGVTAGAHAPTVSVQELSALAPDVILLKPCGFPIERSLAEADLISGLRRNLDAATRVVLTDGNAYFNRPGPRLVESLEILAAAVHPAQFQDLAEKHADALHIIQPGELG
ncbi:MAG: ABC transporter substrate-binding protein, partial [Pseudomonadota bacterium]